MTFSSFEAVFFTVGFLVPGFVWSAVLAMLVPRRASATEVRLLAILTLSCINHGLFGVRSFASDHPANRDLYLEAEFRPIEESGDWAPVEDSAGVLIMADEISVIELRKLDEVTYDG